MSGDFQNATSFSGRVYHQVLPLLQLHLYDIFAYAAFHCVVTAPCGLESFGR